MRLWISLNSSLGCCNYLGGDYDLNPVLHYMISCILSCIAAITGHPSPEVVYITCGERDCTISMYRKKPYNHRTELMSRGLNAFSARLSACTHIVHVRALRAGDYELHS